jgi:hypothetical protein
MNTPVLPPLAAALAQGLSTWIAPAEPVEEDEQALNAANKTTHKAIRKDFIADLI